MAIFLPQSSADSSRAGIVERRCIVRMQHAMQFAALFGSNQLQASLDFGIKKLKTISITVHKMSPLKYATVTSVSCQAGIFFVEMA